MRCWPSRCELVIGKLDMNMRFISVARDGMASHLNRENSIGDGLLKFFRTCKDMRENDAIPNVGLLSGQKVIAVVE